MPSPKRQPTRSTPIAEAAAAISPHQRVLTANEDLIDLRDKYYQPPLRALRRQLPPDSQPFIFDQGTEGACTGFALAAAIEMFKRHRSRRELLEDPSTVQPPLNRKDCASQRMLYEMAKLHDEIQEFDQSGSTLRGVLKGFFHNGVCSRRLAPYIAHEKGWTLDLDAARDARNVSLGAYYRLRPTMSDYHAALNETGAIIVSAQVHEGWRSPNMFQSTQTARSKKNGVIAHEENTIGGHAFAIIGYDENGFLVQNSWGESWGHFQGRPGIAHWCYDDWAENIMDAWVLQLGVPTPSAFHLTHTLVRPNFLAEQAGTTASQARRQDVIGHMIHLDDGKLVKTGRYSTPLASLEATSSYLAGETLGQDRPMADDLRAIAARFKPAREKYSHILFFAHGGLAGPEVGARRISRMREVWKRNRIYPVHFMWETGITETVFETLDVIYQKARERAGDRPKDLDRAIETMVRGLGSKVWRAIKADAAHAFGIAEDEGEGYEAFMTLMGANHSKDQAPYRIHFAGHSAGSILIGHCIERWAREHKDAHVENCFLLAPACTIQFYDDHFRNLLAKKRIGRIVQYGLSEVREDDDHLGHYGKSMLNLVANAFEDPPAAPDPDVPGTPLLGLQRFHASKDRPGFVPPAGHHVYFSGTIKDQERTDARSHNGFASDIQTLNDMLRTILGRPPRPELRFTEADVVGL